MSDPMVAQSSRERQARLYLLHPEGSPEWIGVLPYLIHPPSKLSSNALWQRFRDRTLLPMIEQRPDDPNLPNFLREVEAVLAWRATIPRKDHFWKADADENQPRHIVGFR